MKLNKNSIFPRIDENRAEPFRYTLVLSMVEKMRSEERLRE